MQRSTSAERTRAKLVNGTVLFRRREKAGEWKKDRTVVKAQLSKIAIEDIDSSTFAEYSRVEEEGREGNRDAFGIIDRSRLWRLILSKPSIDSSALVPADRRRLFLSPSIRSRDRAPFRIVREVGHAGRSSWRYRSHARAAEARSCDTPMPTIPNIIFL